MALECLDLVRTVRIAPLSKSKIFRRFWNLRFLCILEGFLEGSGGSELDFYCSHSAYTTLGLTV